MVVQQMAFLLNQLCSQLYRQHQQGVVSPGTLRIYQDLLNHYLSFACHRLGTRLTRC